MNSTEQVQQKMKSSEKAQQAVELTKQDLPKTAEKLESEILAKIKFTPTRVIVLDGLLFDTYVRMCPKPIDYFNRRDLVRIFNLMTKEIYGNGYDTPFVEGYGSFVMDMFTDESDLDLSINFHDPEFSRNKKIRTLQKFKNRLHSLERLEHVTGIQAILFATVPIVKVIDKGTGIECDLSVNNWDGILKSKIIHAISAIDERFRKLCFLMKSWAKAHDINSSKDGTLNSLSIVLFVAFHLQTCNPPILPPFSILLKDGADLVSVTKNVETYFNYGKQNEESLTKLFITLLVKLASVESLWKQGICASVYEGSWIVKTWNRPYSMRVEDFMDRSQNVARAVGAAKAEIIYRCIHKSLSYLSQFLNDQIQGIELMDFLFGTHTVSTPGVGGTSNINGNNLPSLENLRPQKKPRLMEGIVENLAKRHSQGNILAQYLQGKELQGMGLMQQSLGNVANNAHASFPPSVSYQHPLHAPSSNIEVHHGPGVVPSPFTLQPFASGGSFIPSVQSGIVSFQSFRGGVESLHQEVLAPNPRGGSFPPSSLGPQSPMKRPYHRI